MLVLFYKQYYYFVTLKIHEELPMRVYIINYMRHLEFFFQLNHISDSSPKIHRFRQKQTQQ